MEQLTLEKTIARPVPEVFNALKAGRLFMNCSADSASMQIDFRVGGKYRIVFENFSKDNYGEFLEIVPDKKIVFTWCQDFSDQKPDTKVTIELFPEGNKTRLVLNHSGFKNKDICEGHRYGWTSGLNDLDAELESGTLRLVRSYPVTVDQLYDTYKNPENLFGHMGDLARGSVNFKVNGKYQVPTKTGQVLGEFLEIKPNEKIVISWLEGCGRALENSRVTLKFSKRDKGGALLELIHEGLPTTEDQLKHRAGWDYITHALREKLGGAMTLKN